jgi:hypothetical protein
MKKTSLVVYLSVMILAFPSISFAGATDDLFKFVNTGASDLRRDPWGALHGAGSAVYNTGVGAIGGIHQTLSSGYNNIVVRSLTTNTMIRDVYKQVGSINPLGMGGFLQTGMRSAYNVATNPSGSYNSVISRVNSASPFANGALVSYKDWKNSEAAVPPPPTLTPGVRGADFGRNTSPYNQGSKIMSDFQKIP